jgi:large subunit ribosomal protein L5
MNLWEKYQKEIKGTLQKELKISNVMAVPKLTKIVVNVGLGEALQDQKILGKVADQLAVITGQKPSITRAKKSIATFKLRAGDKIGIKVTMRGKRMYDFLEKLTKIALPRVRDFRGVSRKNFDHSGNYSLGLTEQIVFPEIEYSKIDRIRGLQLTFVTNVKKDEHALALLEKLGMPFEKV